MKAPKQLLPILLLCCAFDLFAQFYAPDTEFHDVVQRRFPVECVRVASAWRHATADTSTVAEIAYQVNSEGESHRWHIVLKGSSGEALQHVDVEYPNSLLRSGPGFFREIARQVAAQLKIPIQATGASLAEEYWRGSALAQISREASLTNAFNLSLTLNRSNQAVVAASLAGLLAHATLPAQAGQVTLDGLLLARAATWLAWAEGMEGNKLDPLWTPILFQAGRYPDSELAWKSRPMAWTNHAYVRLWDVWIARPNTQAVYLAACERQARPLAMAMLAFDASCDGTWALLEDLLPHLIPDRVGQLGLHNYAPLIAARGAVGHGHQMAMAPLLQRLDWVRILEGRNDREVGELKTVLEAAATNLRSSLNSKRPAELATAGLEAVTPLLRLAEKESLGALQPTSVATLRDLLCYGWEMGGWQLGARFRFLDQRFGSRENSRPVKNESLRASERWAPFFEASSEEQPGRGGDIHRLQFVTETVLFSQFRLHPYVGTANWRDGQAIRTFINRCWLMPAYAPWFQACLAYAKLDSEMVPTMDRVIAEGGMLQMDPVLDYLATWNSALLQKTPGLFELRKRLAVDARQPNVTTVNVLYDDLLSGKDGLARAQELERLFWRNTDSGLEDRVFRAYAADGRAKDAKRFYFRIRSLLTDPVKVSNNLGQKAWMLGYCNGDAELRRAAIQDSSCGSMADLQLQAWEAAVAGDLSGLRTAIDDIIGRYPDSRGTDAWRRIRDFVDLLPALADRRHPARGRALDYFGRDSSAVVLRWIWIRQYKLSSADAIRFLGGREVDYVRKVLAFALEKDIKGADAALCDVTAPKTGITAQTIMAYWAFHELNGVPDQIGEDVMPESARFTRDAVKDRLGLAK